VVAEGNSNRPASAGGQLHPRRRDQRSRLQRGTAGMASGYDNAP